MPTTACSSLKRLLKDCTDDDPHLNERGWREFFKQYKSYLIKVIINTAAKRKHHRIAFLQSETANEILCEVILLLCEKKYRRLKQFRAVDSERSFRAFLATIAVRTTEKHLRQDEIQSIETVKMTAPEALSHLPALFFEHIVDFIRSSASPKETNVELKILIFNLYVMGDFSSETLSSHPLFKDIGHRVLDNSINRTKRKFLNFLHSI